MQFPYAFNFHGERLFLIKTMYSDNKRTAFMIEDVEGLPFATLTVNIPEIQLREGEFLVKTWSENEDIADHIRNLDLFIDTGKRFRTGFVVGEIWEMRSDRS